MWGGGGTGGSGGGGGLDPSALAGYASMGWVEDSYVSKAFFNQLFEYQYNHRVLTKDGETVVSDVTTSMVAAPNEVVDLVSHTETDEETGYTIITTNTITGIKAKAGLWTNQYLSALGQNSSGGGGGGGGSSTLQGLLDVNIPASMTENNNGQGLVYDYTQNRWVNKTLFTAMGYANNVLSVTISGVTKTVTIQAGTTSIDWANITSKPTTIAGYGITDAKIENGTITLGANSITPLVASDIADMATKTWTSSNYLSKADAANTYLSIAFFSRLFQAKNGNTNVNPNDTTSTIDSIKAMFGFWTDQYLSALGQNSGGGGGGGSTTLAGLNDVDLGTLSNGQVLMYNSTTGKWYNGTVQHGSTVWGDITGTPTTIAGYGITDAKIDSGTITLGSNTITPLTSVAFNDLTSHPTTIAGYGITDAKFGTAGADYVPITLGSTTKNVLTAHQSLSAYATQTWVTNNFLGINATAAAATKLATPRELWGQSFDGTAAVTGTLSYVGDINSNALGSINNFNKIELNAAANSGNGGAIYFHYNGISGRASGYIINDADGLVSVLTSTGNIGLKVGTQTNDYIQIGDIRIVYDNTDNRNSLKVVKSDGTAANLYTTGGVSALGMSAGVSSIDAMTFGYLKVNDQLVFGNNQALIYKDDYLYIECSDTISVNNVEFDYSGNVYTNGSVRAAKFYLDSNRYLYVSGGTLYYYNGSTNKQVAFTN